MHFEYEKEPSSVKGTVIIIMFILIGSNLEDKIFDIVLQHTGRILLSPDLAVNEVSHWVGISLRILS